MPHYAAHVMFVAVRRKNLYKHSLFTQISCVYCNFSITLYAFSLKTNHNRFLYDRLLKNK